MLSVGEILKNQREKLGISLRDIEEQLKVRQKFLRSIEENNWSNFTSKVYIEGIINNYSKFLGVDPRRAIAFFRRDYERLETVKFKRRFASGSLTPETKKIVGTLLFLIFILFFGYFGYQLKLYFSPPKLSILEPRKDKFFKEDKIEIVGKTEKDAAVTIFGERVFQDKEGVFEFQLPLKKGENELIIEVVGANGRKTVLKKIYTRTE